MPRAFGNPKRMPTGAYRNLPMSQIPKSHLEWFNKWYRKLEVESIPKSIFRPEFKLVKEELQRRNNNGK